MHEHPACGVSAHSGRVEAGHSLLREVCPFEWGMDALKQYGKELGLTVDEVDLALRLERPASDASWVTAADLGPEALRIAVETMESGRYVEYACYDDRGNPQGRAIIKLQSWEDQVQGLLTAEHGEASDEYYQWYADNTLATGAVYHICSGEQKRCRMKLARGDKREMVHLDHWRLLSPAAMMNAAYLRPLGERLGRKQLEAKAQAKTAAPVVDPPGGTGLEAAVEAARKAVESIGPAKGQARERSPRRKHSQSPSEKRGRTRSLDEHLRKGIERTKELERSRSKKRGRTDKRDRRRHSRGGHGTGSRERSSDSSRSSGSSHFRKTSARGGDLWRVAQKKPGHLAVRSLNEMTRYLSERTDWAEDENAWSGQKVMAYLNQVVLVNHQPAKIGVRSHRELVTLAMALDAILAGQLKQSLDLLMQRFKAVEASFQEGGWNTAKHLEIIPPSAASLTREDERHMAARSELLAVKLRESLAKLQRPK